MDKIMEGAFQRYICLVLFPVAIPLLILWSVFVFVRELRK